MDEQHLSLRDVGERLGVSHTTVLRALRGGQVDLETLMKIAEWLNIRPSALLDNASDGDDIEAKTKMLIDAYPQIQDVLEKAVVAIENGQADPGLIKDIVAYAEFRIQSNGG